MTNKGFDKSRRTVLRGGLSLAALTALNACTMGDFDFDALRGRPTKLPQPPAPAVLPLSAGETFGKGPVRVALLLPLSDPSLANVGLSMANGSKLAVQFIEASPNIADNVTVVLKDTGGNPQIAAQRASEAIGEGASIILGPLRAEEVTAAGNIAKSAGIPLIGFSNNTGAASPGVYLLNVLPGVEVRRSLGFVKSKGRKSFAAIFPNTAYGQIQQGAFRQASADLGINARAVYNFSNEAEARAAIGQLIPFIKDGSVDALFIPDRATAPSFGVLLDEAGVSPQNLTIIGSADWDGDTKITQTSFLSGAVYPSVDDAGYQTLKAEYQAKFGSIPHPLTTIAYTATILANASTLSLSNPRYNPTTLTMPGGFNGRDGVFRFLPDGRSEYALVIKQVSNRGAVRVDGAKL